MKASIKILGIFFFGLLSAVVIYPFLHESGHSFIALTVGAEVVDFHIFPIPSVMCDVLGISSLGLTAIGLGGIFIPYLISFVLRPKTFWGWYTNSIVRSISLLSIGISIVSIILQLNGISIQNEDIVQILNILSGGEILFLIGLTLLFAYGFIRMLADKPLEKISRYFNL